MKNMNNNKMKYSPLIYKPFVTGSSAYGPFNEDSDIDIVMVYQNALELKELLKQHAVNIEDAKEKNKDYEGFKFMLFGRYFQIISLNVSEYNKWFHATQEMRKLPEINNKQKRINIFQELKEGYY